MQHKLPSSPPIPPSAPRLRRSAHQKADHSHKTTKLDAKRHKSSLTQPILYLAAGLRDSELARDFLRRYELVLEAERVKRSVENRSCSRYRRGWFGCPHLGQSALALSLAYPFWALKAAEVSFINESDI